jgi:drug/metabolite transporter (DMT)-like permease
MLKRWRPRTWQAGQAQGISAALLSAVVLGLAPIFGKQAMLAGTPPLTVVAVRTVTAAAALWLVLALTRRQYLYIYPVGLLGCLAAGTINGLGSLMYYSGLGRLDASLAQLLYTLYPVALTLFARLQGHRIGGLTLFRMALALAAVLLLTRAGGGPTDWLGVGLMVGAGVMYAAHLVVSQRVLYDVPAPTVALYNLSAMAVTVSIGYAAAGAPALPPTGGAWQAVLLLTLVTIISRLSLFMGVKRLGGVQAALIGLSELLVTVLCALVLLGESLSAVQWLGAVLLAASVLLVTRERGLGPPAPAPKPWAALVGRPGGTVPFAPPAAAEEAPAPTSGGPA